MLNLPPRETANWPILLAKAENHWRRHCPKLVASLEKEGKLQQALENAVETTIISLQQSELAGLKPDQARELAYPNILLPDENPDEP